MRDYFILDGVPSTAFGVFLASSNLFDAPEKDVDAVSVPGRSGDVLISNDRYKNFSGKAVLYIPKDIRKSVEKFKGFLLSRSGYVRYEESTKPGRYRMASYQGPFEMGANNRTRGTLELALNCKPQVFLTAGDVKSSYTGPAMLLNPTFFASQPKLRVYGYGPVQIGSYTVTVAANQYPFIDIDCERMDAYWGTANCNRLIMLSSDFPVLEPGDNAIQLGPHIDSVEITPRWWTL